MVLVSSACEGASFFAIISVFSLSHYAFIRVVIVRGCEAPLLSPQRRPRGGGGTCGLLGGLDTPLHVSEPRAPWRLMCEKVKSQGKINVLVPLTV